MRSDSGFAFPILVEREGYRVMQISTKGLRLISDYLRCMLGIVVPDNFSQKRGILDVPDCKIRDFSHVLRTRELNQ